MSSSPATMFSVVDFPQPDGPTRMMNSPSAISRLKSSHGQRAVGIALDHVVQNDLGHSVLLV